MQRVALAVEGGSAAVLFQRFHLKRSWPLPPFYPPLAVPGERSTAIEAVDCSSWGSKRSEQIFGAYTILGEGERLKFLSLCLPEMGDDEKSFLGLGRAMASKGIMTVEAAQAAMEAEAAAEAAAQKQQAALAALMAGKAAEEAKEASAAQKVRLTLRVRVRLRLWVWVLG